MAQTQIAAPSTATAQKHAADRVPAANAAASGLSERPVEIVKVAVKKARPAAGGGLMKPETAPQDVQSVTRSYIEQQAPASNVLNLVSELPSANVTTGDAFGLRGGNLNIRGFSSDDVGFILDGAPTNGSGAGFANEMADAEDLESVKLTPGSSAIDTPTLNATAGVVYLSLRDPLEKPNVELQLGGGSDSFNREYMRVDTGNIATSGIRGFLSFSHDEADNWRGPGETDKNHVDFKVIKVFKNGSSTALEGSLNRQYTQYYLAPTAEQFAISGNSNNYDPKYLGPSDVNYYKLNRQIPFNAGVIIAPTTIVINPRLEVDDTPYVYSGYGRGTGGTDLAQGSTFEGTANVPVQLNGDPDNTLVNSGFFSKNIQAGNTLKVVAHLGNNTLVAGYWYEKFNLEELDPVGKVNQLTGDPLADYYFLPDGQNYYSAHDNQYYQVNALFIGDKIMLLDNKIELYGGFKDAMTVREVTDSLPGATYRNGKDENQPLPVVSASYRINTANQIFASAQTDFRLPYTFSMVGAYGIASGSTFAIATNPKSEYSIKEEIGYRYTGHSFLASITGFNYNLTNRLLTLNTIENGNQVSNTVNAGGQTSRGFDVQFSTMPIFHHVSLYAGFEYLDARIDNNIASVDAEGRVDYLPTTGKVQIESPREQADIGLRYDDGQVFANLDLRYVGDQYASLTDDETMPAYLTDQESIGYRIRHLGPAHDTKIQLNLFNITNTAFRSGVYSFVDNTKPVTGTFGGTIPSAGSPTYYLQPAFTALVTLSSNF